MNVGAEAPDFCLPNHEGKEHCLHDYRGKWVILYFYPKDNTSGCTREAKEFTEMKEKFEALGAVIIGISKDSPKSHAKFIEKHGLEILLLSDENHEILEKYSAWGKKKNYGREYFGTIRSTFLIAPDGKIVHVWPKVRVNGHVEKVLKKLEEVKK